jgi:hypothetical protein
VADDLLIKPVDDDSLERGRYCGDDALNVPGKAWRLAGRQFIRAALRPAPQALRLRQRPPACLISGVES